MLPIKYIEGLVIFLLVALSGFPLFITGKEGTIIIFIIFLCITVRYGKTDIFKNQRIINFLLLFLGLSFVQLLIHGQYDFFSFSGLLMRVLIAIMAIPFLGQHFYSKYTTLIYKLSIISLVIYFLFFLIPDTYDLALKHIAPIFGKDNSSRGYEYINNIFVYVFNQNNPRTESIFDYRNPGPFWEPGAFGVFIIIALFFNIFFINDKLFSRKNLVFIFTLITTFSTTSYFALVLIIVGISVFKTKKFNLLGGAFAALILFLFSFLYESLPFLQEKINQRNISYNDAVQKDIKQDRIGTFYKDVSHLLKNPIIGYGFDPKNKIENFEDWDVDLVHKNNGVSDILLIFGIPIGLYYLFRIVGNAHFFTVIHDYPPISFKVYFFLLLILVGFSEIIFIQILFIFLSFLPDGLTLKYKPIINGQ